MKDFKSIKIIHNVDNRIEFLFFAEFFRLCGIYVVEDIQITNDDGIKNDILVNNLQDDFDAEIYVGLSEGNSALSFNPSVILLQQVYFSLGLPMNNCHISKLALNVKLQLISGVLLILDAALQAKNIVFDLPTFQSIGMVYVSHDLMKYFANIQYYRINYSKQEETKRAFVNAYDSLQKLGLDNKTINYAKLYCASKANVSSYCLDETFVYEIKKLADGCLQLIRNYPDFSNAWVLRGLIYEYDTEFAREAVSAFERAVEDEGDHSYTSHMLYWIAKRYEAYTVNEPEAFDYYEKSYRTKPRFRNIYKLAMMSKNRDEYEKALEYFDMILASLKTKYDRDYLDPLECEYYYKANSLAAYICCVCIKEYERAIKYSNNAIEFVNKLKYNKFYSVFYGEQSGEYLNITKNRMNLKKIYQYLAVSNRELRRFEEAQVWWDRIIAQEN